MAEVVKITSIIADPRCQSRTGLDAALVHEYAEAIKDGAALPPLSAIRAEEGHYLYDGFHRLEAYRLAGVDQVAADSEPGDIWDAIERSCAVNAMHGKRRTNEDKRRAVETMLKVMAHRGENWSNREIARRCAVSEFLVRGARGDNCDKNADATATVTRNGTTYEMNTENIGKRQPEPELFVMDDGPAVDEDTGEILDDEPAVESEQVDPNDIAFRAGIDMPPVVSLDDPHSGYQRVTPAKPSPNGTATATVSRAESIAARLVKELGRSLALEVADQIYEIADE